MVQGKIRKADTPTVRLGATPSKLVSDPPPSSPYFYAGCPSCITLPIYPGWDKHRNMLDCIPLWLDSYPQTNKETNAQ